MKSLEKNSKTYDSSGITLISLVITIIVLLILAGVTISAIVGDNGILSRATQASAETIASQEKEQIALAYSAATVSKLGESIEESDLQNELNNVIPNETVVTTISNGVFEVYFNKTRNCYQVDNYGSIVAIEREPVPEGMVARIDTTYYPTLQEAVNASLSDGSQTTIYLLTDVFENINILENQNIILNLKHNTITNANETPVITVSGALHIQSGTVIGEYVTQVATIYVSENAELNLSNSNIDRISEDDYGWETIELYGNLNMNSGKINSLNSNAICTYDGYETKMTISGGEIYSNANTVINSDLGTLVISGGNITCARVTVINRGIIDITGGIIVSEQSNVISNYGTAKITGDAQIKSNAQESYPAIYNQEGGNLNVLGGQIEAIKSAIANKSEGTVVISGGIIKSTSANAISNYGTLEITGNPEISSTANVGYMTIANGKTGTLIATDGKITSLNDCAINNYGIAQIGGNVEITTNSDAASTIYNREEGTVIISGGKISAVKPRAIYNCGITEITGNPEITSSENIAIQNHPGANLVISGGNIKSTSSNAIGNSGTVEIAGGIIVSEKSNVILNYGTVGITGGIIVSEKANVIINCGTAKVTGDAQLKSNAQENYPAIYNQENGNLNVLGGQVEATKVAIGNKSGGTVAISGGIIKSTSSNAINNSGTVEITGNPEISSTANVNYPTIYNQETSTLIATGGKITSLNDRGIYNCGNAQIGGNVEITTNSDTSSAVYNDEMGTLEISGGTIIATKNTAYAVYNYNGNATITGGTIQGKVGGVE